MDKLFVYHGTVYTKNTHFRFFCEQKCFRISLHCSLLRPFMVRKLLLLKYHLGQKFNFFSAKIFQKQRGDSSSRGHELESQYRILGTWLIFHNRCCQMFEAPKKSEKEAGGRPIKKNVFGLRGRKTDGFRYDILRYLFVHQSQPRPNKYFIPSEAAIINYFLSLIWKRTLPMKTCFVSKSDGGRNLSHEFQSGFYFFGIFVVGLSVPDIKKQIRQ